LIRRFTNLTAAFAIVASLFFFAAVPQVHADDRGHCQRAIEKAESRLDHAVQRNGPRSREADDRRRDLNAERDRCWSAYHQWWNGREHRWETERNWDRDHDDDRH
jgi:hypothetical protein